MTAPKPRPTSVTAAFWLLVVGGVMLLSAGLITATIGFDTLRRTQPATVSDASVHNLLVFNRGLGVLFAVAAVALVWLAARARDRDPRLRRATIALGLVLVVLIALSSLYAGHILALLSLLPIVVGTLLLNRPGAVEWYAGD